MPAESELIKEIQKRFTASRQVQSDLYETDCAYLIGRVNELTLELAKACEAIGKLYIQLSHKREVKAAAVKRQRDKDTPEQREARNVKRRLPKC